MTNSYSASGRKVVGLDRPASGLTVTISVDVPGDSGNTYRSPRFKPAVLDRRRGVEVVGHAFLLIKGGGGRHGSEQQADVAGAKDEAERARGMLQIQLIRLLVADHLLTFRIKIKGAAQPVRSIGQVD